MEVLISLNSGSKSMSPYRDPLVSSGIHAFTAGGAGLPHRLQGVAKKKKSPNKAQEVESAYQVITATVTIILKGRLFK